ncbi:MAG: D-tyrosyl-tRNA(Tyr) deacylase [Cellvibrionaceae bacterium]|nr:D-tyrosyl-tRNA(Tyr) deacylase [Cellvibrionaceae bacterium]
MKALIQRVTEARVSAEGHTLGAINRGLLVLLGLEKNDSFNQADKLLKKLFAYRIFNDEQSKMNLSLQAIAGEMLIVSQFTLAAQTHKGLRPGFSSAAAPEQARRLYDYFIQQAQVCGKEYGNTIATGRFGADMQVALINDGPVTFMLEV